MITVRKCSFVLEIIAYMMWYHLMCCCDIRTSYVLYCRCPYLTTTYSIGIPVYQSVIALFVVANFGLATFMDPGLYPRGWC